MSPLHKRIASLGVLFLPVLLLVVGVLLGLSEPTSHSLVVLRSLLLWPGDLVMFVLSAFQLYEPRTVLITQRTTALWCLPWYYIVFVPLTLYVRERRVAFLVIFLLLLSIHICIGGFLGELTFTPLPRNFRF